MPERGAHPPTLRVGRPLRLGVVTLWPIECVMLTEYRQGDGLHISALLEPRALVVRDGKGVHAFDADGSTMALDPLHEQVPALAALLVQD